jgi:hypothetical protein
MRPHTFNSEASRNLLGREVVEKTTVLLLVALAAAFSLGGCAQVPVWKQERVSKPNMVFNDRGAFMYGPRLNAQLEPGSADNGGAAAAGCTACK